MGTRNTIASLTKDLGDTGLDVTWGMMHGANDFLKEWRGTNKIKNIGEMLSNSSVIGGALRLAFELPMTDARWSFVSDQGEEDPRIEFLEEAFQNMTHSWIDHLQEALLMPFYGWSLFTVTYERVNGRYMWRKFKMLGHDTIQHWNMADDGGLESVQQYPHLWPTPIPIERCLLYRFRKTKNDPYGESILRPAWTSWYFVKNIQQIEAIGIERRLAGMPVIYPPQGTDMSDNSDASTMARKIVRNIRNDQQAGVVMPPPVGPEQADAWRLELLSAQGGSQTTDTDTVIKRYESRMLQAALAQFLMLGQDRVGAYSTFQGGADFFTMALNALADNIAETFTKYAVTRLLRLNGFDPNGVSLTHAPIGDVDLGLVGAFLQQMGNKVTWTTQDEMWIRDLLRLPELSPEEIEDEKEARREIAQQFIPQQQPQQTADLSKAELFAAVEAGMTMREQMLADVTADHFAGMGEALAKEYDA